MEAELVARRQGFDPDTGNLAVGHAEHRSIEGADACRPEADVVHGPDRVAELEEVPDAHGLVEDERQARDDVLERLLGGERDGDAPDAQPGECRGRIEPEIAKGRQPAGHDDQHVCDATRHAKERSRLAAGREAPPNVPLRRNR